MRDAHRMKEKLDLSLDNRQVVSLIIGGLVVLGAVFVLGVVVGKKLSTNQTAGSAPDLLTALDRQAEAMQEVRKDPPLTFQDELTKKTPAVVIAPPPAPAPKPAPVETPKPVEVKPASATAPAAAADTKPAVAEATKPAAPAAEPDGKVEEAPVATRTSDGGLKDAFARASQTTAAKATVPAEAKAGGAWTLQLSASQSKDEADKFAARVREKGYAPFIVRAEVPGRGTWYRVRMGSFPTKEAASRYLQDFKRETSIDAFIASAN